MSINPAQAHTGSSGGQRAVRAPLLPLAWAGIIGPVLFTVTFLAQELFLFEEFSPVAEPVSALVVGPHGWVQTANFLVFAVLTVAFAVGLHRGIGPARAGVLGPALFVLTGVGLLVAMSFPITGAAGDLHVPVGHRIGGMLFFLGSMVAFLALAPRLARDPRWRSLATYTAILGLVGLLAFLATGVLVVPDQAAFHDFAGLAQRVVVLAVIFPGRVLLSVRLLRVASE